MALGKLGSHRWAIPQTSICSFYFPTREHGIRPGSRGQFNRRYFVRSANGYGSSVSRPEKAPPIIDMRFSLMVATAPNKFAGRAVRYYPNAGLGLQTLIRSRGRRFRGPLYNLREAGGVVCFNLISASAI